MIKDILLVLPADAKDSAALDYSLAAARTFEAHLAGAAIVHDLIVPGTVFDSAAASLLAEFRRQSEIAARAAIGRFEERCRREGQALESITLDSREFGSGETLARQARRFDVTILGRTSAEGGEDDVLVEAALFKSGRPVVVVPSPNGRPFKLDRVLVCWDGSASATRALADAMPLLHRADRVEIVTVTPDTKPSGLVPGTDIARHLSRHGVKVEIVNLVADKMTVAARILAHAADHAADLVVMGGYGHSRLREFVLGGMTREILETTTVPTLMSH